jgi:hypothetical protein
MKSFKKEINLKKVFRNRKYNMSLFGFKPTDDWRLLLLIATFLLLFMAVAGLAYYKNLVGGVDENIKKQEVQSIEIDTERLNELIDFYFD